MIYLAAISLALAVGLTVVLVGQLIPARPRLVRQRLAEVEALTLDPMGGPVRRERQARRQRVVDFLEVLGARIERVKDTSVDRQLLMHAGYRSTGALSVYWGFRLALPAILGAAAFVVAPLAGASPQVTLIAVLYFALVGYVAPPFYVRSRAKKRQKDMQKALPDALDLLVVCVEAGLGLNHALLRVSQEIGHVSRLTATELALVNAEIRAGVPREEALRNLAERTGLEDMRSLVTVLIQTDRFGTSVAKALRVHADTMRQKRRQRCEETAAKTTIKLVFPLALCIFPAMFIVVLGPALIQIARELAGMA
jgi:tight adherence protein C